MRSFDLIKNELENIAGEVAFSLSFPEQIEHGDYSTNLAFALAKKEGISVKECSEKIIEKLRSKLEKVVSNIEFAGAGFINFYLKDEIRSREALAVGNGGLRLDLLKGKKIICEYTDPNPFKIFHIGHLVPNAIGESLSRIYEAVGAEVIRFNYEGDVGLHVAKTIWGVRNLNEDFERKDLREEVSFLGRAYAFGTEKYEVDENIKKEIIEINKKIFERSDVEINKLYDYGRKASLDYFETIYKKLGTKFDYYIFESEVADSGKEIVLKNIPNIFEESEGAVVYKGEKVGLHTRVFINKEGLPTYEAKEIGNTYRKEEIVGGSDISLVVTANEINEYFKVIKQVLKELDEKLSHKLIHVSHGLLRLPDGKMSSRKGTIIPAEDLIDEVKNVLNEKFENKMDDELLNDIAVGAIKFSILKIIPGKDIVFDFEKSISLNGDSGPYLQYTNARLAQLIIKGNSTNKVDSQVPYEKSLEKSLLLFSFIIEKAYKENAPQHIVVYLLNLAREFNSFYGNVRVIDENGNIDIYYLDLCKAVKNVLSFGLNTLGIKAVEKM